MKKEVKFYSSLLSVDEIIKRVESEQGRNSPYQNSALLVLANAIAKKEPNLTAQIAVEFTNRKHSHINRGSLVECLTALLLDRGAGYGNGGLYRKAPKRIADISTYRFPMETLTKWGLPYCDMDIKYLTGVTNGAELSKRIESNYVLALVSQTRATKGGYYLLKSTDLITDNKGKISYKSALVPTAKYLKEFSKFAGFID